MTDNELIQFLGLDGSIYYRKKFIIKRIPILKIILSPGSPFLEAKNNIIYLDRWKIKDICEALNLIFIKKYQKSKTLKAIIEYLNY